jgi:diamine N-acetyltransferase
MTSSLFSAAPIDLPKGRLVTLEARSCASLAEAIAAIPPWSVVNYPADGLARFLAAPSDGAARYRIEIDGATAGAICVRFPWLKGPYLELMAVLPQFQGKGVGACLLDWFEQEGVRNGARNLWVCASSFNARAVRFYERHGFRPAAVLPGLVADGYDEILLRKFPLAAADTLPPE